LTLAAAVTPAGPDAGGVEIENPGAADWAGADLAPVAPLAPEVPVTFIRRAPPQTLAPGLSAGLLAAWLMPGKICRGATGVAHLPDHRLVLIELSSPPVLASIWHGARAYKKAFPCVISFGWPRWLS
jgi:hypothetical protein